MTRRPLFEVRRSPVHGLGAFALRRIRKGTRIVEYLGGLTMVHVARDADEPVVVQLPGNFHANAGDTVRFDAAASGVHLFDAAGLRLAGGPQ